jgi:hypothetical protein
MTGRGFTNQYVQIYFSGGLGITQGNNRFPDRYDKDFFIAASIPLEIDLMVIPINNLGAGVTLWGDLNVKRPMTGFIVKIGIGKFR